jgi:hypothetical protein
MSLFTASKRRINSLLIAFAFIFHVQVAAAGEMILPYSAFGPQVVAYELIGKEWWQWDAHGDSRPREYPIKVVVYWDQTREQTAKRYPVNKSKLQDYRYVEYSKAVAHMQKVIKELKAMELDTSTIQRSLNDLKKKRQSKTNRR